jgi:hypothetical protein
MARRLYFAFDYQDVFEVNQIRRSGEFVGVAVDVGTDQAHARIVDSAIS